MRHWTDETDREADELYPTFTDAKIRHYQDLAEQQIARAYPRAVAGDLRMSDAIADLQRMQDALAREMGKRTGRKSARPRVRKREAKP